MRNFLDLILTFIGSESLTDDEFAALPEGLSQFFIEETYEALKSVLDAREAASETQERLKAVFRAKGLVIGTSTAIPRSNILLGDEL